MSIYEVLSKQGSFARGKFRKNLELGRTSVRKKTDCTSESDDWFRTTNSYRHQGDMTDSAHLLSRFNASEELFHDKAVSFFTENCLQREAENGGTPKVLLCPPRRAIAALLSNL